MKRALLAALCAVLLGAGTAAAQRPFGIQGFGPRGGVSIDPDQIHFGGQLDLGDLAPQLMLIPNIEVGVGDNVTVIAPMFEVDYRFLEDWGSWNPYLGSGIGPVFVSHDRGGDDTELGVTVQGGIARHLSRASGFFFLEFKLGLVDYPDAKFTVGWSFGSTGGGAKSR
jgi:opacity protein-like surface antigen